MVLPDDSYGLSMLRGVGRYVAERGMAWEFARRASFPLLRHEQFAGWKGDGVIATIREPVFAAACCRQARHVVNVSHQRDDLGLPVVGPDDEAIGRMGATYLLSRGFRNLAFVGIGTHAYSRRRERGFVARLADAGIEPILHRAPPGGTEATDLAEVKAWVASLPPSTAVMGANDIRGRHVVTSCHELGRDVPDDIAVLGVDNDEWQAMLARLPLSSIDPDPVTIGYRAAAMLADLMTGRPRGAWTNELVPPKGVITRRSTDVIASEDPLVARAVAFVRERSLKPLTVDDLLDHVDVSRRSLEMRFRRFLGYSPQQAIWRAHVERAQSLLIETDLPMKDVAQRSGFTSQERFSVVFRRETGSTPTEFRIKFRRG
jgi:LacI family transcriptional regulator